jgi:RNase H-fold protein (predicted Holliday junction resolvase)
MGNQTTSKQWQTKLKDKLKLSIDILLVDEKNSTLEARTRYWQIYPPKGLTRLIPPGLRVPPRPVDDIVAIILIERYLHNKLFSQ